MRSYKFEFVEYTGDQESKTIVEFTTDNESWSGYDGPMWKFFEFLKGCGFVFDSNVEIGVMEEDGEFRSATED